MSENKSTPAVSIEEWNHEYNFTEEEGKRLSEASKIIGDLPVCFNVMQIEKDNKLIDLPTNKKYGKNIFMNMNYMPDHIKDLGIKSMGIHPCN